ncbi:NAD(P)H-dependent oxidoreductase [Mucilaginibacter sp. UR6-1]|uniref:NADPH-dependent FMN reductase n=1 Tax=Mucilaginibacter sp. UR6-1 TaxID=1435643 RepID=UPI001E507A12|nr:NAD(P)H-dependent oxidoreductase [Mucilaginibacter sp. UR6-1]MCC8407766.1 NAD(P)H-dependent oxidoreductase [Mucilaginibacter sp. UR6-1]
MKILAFAGSNSAASINKKLVTYVASFFREHTIEVLDLNDYEMPLFGVDKIAKTGIPQQALDFAEKIDESHLLLISLAENNGAYTTAFKNIFDWISVIPERKAFWGDKPTFVMATSPGPRGGASVLNIASTTLPYYGAKIIDTFSLPGFHENFDSEKGITHAGAAAELQSKIEKIKADFLV